MRIKYTTYHVMFIDWFSMEIPKLHCKPSTLVETKRTECDVFTFIVL